MSAMPPEYYMKLALQEAEKAYQADEVPVGAVIVMQDTVIAKGYNQVELLQDATAHAEIIALTSAFQHLGSKYIPDATLYVTLEPCVMCSGALYWSKIGAVVYGASDDKNGFHATCAHSPFHPRTNITSGISDQECAQLMKDFFKQKRK
ncbi:MAG: nucleoside deaminase [Chitinophagaceae bacterium]|nr:nucleoside deaminase [Chitinophagaceae bacterium]